MNNDKGRNQLPKWVLAGATEVAKSKIGVKKKIYNKIFWMCFPF